MNQVTTYHDAPLIELIVELRWSVETNSPPGLPPGAPPFVSNTSATFDRWFNTFSTRLEELGYHNIERLVPHDFPPTIYQPIFRYRKKRGMPFPVIQFGHGIFTINAGPPDYISWNLFRPEVESGIKALIESKPKTDDSPGKFISANVRYIDAFRAGLRADLSNFKFMRDDLQSCIQLPTGILDLAESEDLITPTMVVRFPLKDREHSILTLQIAAGQANKEPATVMEMTCNTRKAIQMSTASALEILDESRDVLHSVFEIMTKKIHERMKPVVGGE